MKKVEFEQYSNEELLSKRNSFYTELFNLRTQLITGQLGNMKKVKERKKDIARIYTILKERQLKNEKTKTR
ncbi:MAG: 50S ribosomal protein L29 [Candidatus Omnitrophica bacterium]|nr:50S ribosomal protein L29 [Candidatus Omnitrophota bacterium]MBU1048151.1 50S ribosomal protein L29 [Candidatus Omnitrophota bacterium]MBU1767384.1 50S ribosomal protein L29 [Candidatus Omnitrophota bacterium]MBU1889246.1 50S ribosomal protein L29 [Candidatus Omnitrophota bacterium]